MNKVLILSAIATLAAVPASAQDTSMAFNETSRIYAGIADKHYWGETEEIRRNTVLAQLNATCASTYKSEQRKCAKAWKIINAAYADLQAKRALQPAG
jgi:opacity protein-like surface antigen